MNQMQQLMKFLLLFVICMILIGVAGNYLETNYSRFDVEEAPLPSGGGGNEF